jgi:hypothetical protein
MNPLGKYTVIIDKVLGLVRVSLFDRQTGNEAEVTAARALRVTADISGSAPPVGAATAANQATEIGHLAAIEGSVASIDGKMVACDTGAIAGSVTANAGTNLNTSALALESGGNLATIAGKDFATETTLALIQALLTLIKDTDGIKKITDTVTVQGTTTANQGTANTAANGWPVKPTDGTNYMPTGDVSARKLFVRHTDGTNDTPAGDSRARPIFVDGRLSDATTPNEYYITLTTADTEYSQALPANTKKIFFKCREARATRYAFTTGKVATPTDPYFTMSASEYYDEDGLNLTGKTVYFAADVNNTHMELLVWS